MRNIGVGSSRINQGLFFVKDLGPTWVLRRPAVHRGLTVEAQGVPGLLARGGSP